MATASDILARIKDEEIEWVDLRFTDPKGKWQHLTMVASVLGERAGRRPDVRRFVDRGLEGHQRVGHDPEARPRRVYVDPFSATPMLILVCDIVEPSTGELYARDPARPPSAPKPS
jgi:glutamine synthetase